VLRGLTGMKPEFSDFEHLDSTLPGTRRAVVWAREGMSSAHKGDLLSALSSLQQALDIDLDCYEAWLGLCEVFSKLHDGRRAAACLEVARRIRRRRSLATA